MSESDGKVNFKSQTVDVDITSKYLQWCFLVHTHFEQPEVELICQSRRHNSEREREGRRRRRECLC